MNSAAETLGDVLINAELLCLVSERVFEPLKTPVITLLNFKRAKQKDFESFCGGTF